MRFNEYWELNNELEDLFMQNKSQEAIELLEHAEEYIKLREKIKCF